MRYIANLPGSTILFLLVLVPLLRWPSLQGVIFQPEESLHYVVAQRVMENGALYTDAWYPGPPLMIWLYEGLYALLGEHTLTAVHLLTCLIVFFFAIYFTGWIAQLKPFSQFPGLPAVLFVWLTAVPWYEQQLSGNLIMLFPILLAFQVLLRIVDSRQSRNGSMTMIGVYIMLATLINYRGVFIGAGVVAAYLLLRPVRLDELFSLVGGMLLVFLGMLFILFIRGNISDYWDVGLLYYLDRTGLTGQGVYDYEVLFTLKTFLLSWGVLLALAMIGFIHFRLRFFSQVAKIRSLETIMAAWLVGLILMIMFKWSRLDWTDFILAAPPLSFYATKVMEFRWRRVLRWIVMVLILAIPAYQYWHYIRQHISPELTPQEMATEWVGNRLVPQRQAAGIAQKLAKQSIQNGIWIMAYEPTLYPLLGYPCANKYIDFRMAYYKIESLPGYASANLLAKTESDRDIFLQFTQEPPDIVLDPQDFFPLLQKRYPKLLGNYVGIFAERYRVYSLSPSAQASH